MAAKFLIEQAFELRSRAMLMIVGEILDGVAHVGDRVSGLGRDVSVAGVEMLTRSDGTCAVALGIGYANDDDLADLRRSATSGLELSLTAGEST